MISLLKKHGHLVLFGFMLTFLSGFGQTFLISLYVPEMQSFFELSDGQFSSFYAAATLASAFTLMWVGRFIDSSRLTSFVLFVMLGLIVALVIVSQTYGLLVLPIGLFGLRFFGQGLLTHTSITSMARFFDVDRGKALSLASLGHPVSEATLPILVFTSISVIGWRFSLLLEALFVLLCIPIILKLLLLKKEPSQRKLLIPSKTTTAQDKAASRPSKVFASRAFWLLAPSNFAAAGIGTALIFFQIKIGESFQLSASFVAASFTAYAIASASATFLAGFLVDRFSGKAIFPAYLLPYLVGISSLLIFESAWSYVLMIAGVGAANGFGNTAKNAALAEFYGTKVIGSVRSVFTTVMVFSTAVGPVVFGWFLDAGFGFAELMIGSALFIVGVTFNSLRVYSK